MKIYIPNVTKDELWKGIIEALFEDFLHFFFPKFVEEVDFNQPFIFLDKELQELTPASASKNRAADLLVKIFLKSGEEKWLLIHIEVQGYEDVNFAHRMYIYNYRIYDKFKKEIVALAILTDHNPKYRPTYYERIKWDTIIRYHYKTYKLLDYNETDFEQSKNPFASVIQVARSFIKNKALKTDEDLYSLKIKLFRTMYQKGFSKEKIKLIANFIKHYVYFSNHEFFIKFEQEADNIKKTPPNMDLLTLLRQRTIEKIQEVNFAEGREEGREEGLFKIELQKRKNIKNMLTKKFDLVTIADILEISITEVEYIQQELAIQSKFEQGITINKLVTEYEQSKQKLLLSKEQLATVFQHIQIKKLLLQNVSIDDLTNQFQISKFIIQLIQEQI